MKYLMAGMDSIGRHHTRNWLALGEHDILVFLTHHETLLDVELGRKVYQLPRQ